MYIYIYIYIFFFFLINIFLLLNIFRVRLWSSNVTECFVYLLPSGSKQHEVLQVGSIQEGILQACHSIVQMVNTY